MCFHSDEAAPGVTNKGVALVSVSDSSPEERVAFTVLSLSLCIFRCWSLFWHNPQIPRILLVILSSTVLKVSESPQMPAFWQLQGISVWYRQQCACSLSSLGLLTRPRPAFCHEAEALYSSHLHVHKLVYWCICVALTHIESLKINKNRFSLETIL